MAIQQPKMNPPHRMQAMHGSKSAANTVQRTASTAAMFMPHALRLPPPPPQAVSEELVPRSGGGFQVRSAQRHTLSAPTGTFNFVRILGATPRSQPLLISVRLAPARMAGGRPVIYAGTARFERGEMAWWSNYSGTYQPIAAFRAQAGLPEDNFAPWQKLQMGGVAMQRGTFAERRTTAAPERPSTRPAAAVDNSKSATEPTAAGRMPTSGPGGTRLWRAAR
jgi:hypothetical protein